MKLSIIIPSYNEENTIGEILSRVYGVKIDGLSREFIVVDDGSTDSSESVISNVKFPISNFKLVRHKKNKGKGAAVVTGIKSATGDIIVIQDADLEYNPADIPRLIDPIKSGKAAVVYGTRLRIKPKFSGKNKTPFLLHFYGNKFLSFVTSLLYGSKISDMETGYKAFNKKVLNGIKLKSKSFDFEPEITAKILKKGVKIMEIDIKTSPRGYDEGKKIHTFRDGWRALWTLIKYRFTD